MKELIAKEKQAAEDVNIESESPQSTTDAGAMSLFQGYYDDEATEMVNDQEIERYIVSKITVVIGRLNSNKRYSKIHSPRFEISSQKKESSM